MEHKDTKTQRALQTTKDTKVYFFVPRNLCVFVSLCSFSFVPSYFFYHWGRYEDFCPNNRFGLKLPLLA